MKNTLKLTYYLLAMLLLAACSSGSNRTIYFRGISPDDPQGKEGLYNPGRGFRLETAVDVAALKENPTKQLAALSKKYVADSVSLSQSYFYLTDLVGQKLTPENLKIIQSYFDELKRLGKKAVLRFAYERDFNGRAAVGPTLEQALEHLDELKPFLDKNKDLILVVQAGVIGAWGEWHSSVHGLENSMEAKRAILEKVLEVMPKDKMIQVRIPDYKNIMKDKPELYQRISFHDDFIVIRPDKWDGDMHEGTANFTQIAKESPYLLVDGELPWGFWSVGSDPDAPTSGWLIDGQEAARRFFLQHYTSLSVIHNYKEQHPNKTFSEDNAPEYSMIVWKKTPISKSFLQEQKMPISDRYFEDKEGKEVDRSEFDYIRDHLGYRLELQKLTLSELPNSKQSFDVELQLINRGFSTVHDPHSVYLVLLDHNDQIVSETKLEGNPRDWQPFAPEDKNCTPLVHIIKGVISIPKSGDRNSYRLGLWLPDASSELKYNHRYAIRCANGNSQWYVSKDGCYGINVLTELGVNK